MYRAKSVKNNAANYMNDIPIPTDILALKF